MEPALINESPNPSMNEEPPAVSTTQEVEESQRGRTSDNEPGRILVVDDDQSACELLEGTLKRTHRVVWRTSAQDALELVGEEDFDVILTDLNMAGIGGLDLCERMVGMRPDVPVIVVTGFGSMEAAVGAIRAGAYDFVTKPVDPSVIGLMVERALKHRRLQEEVKRLRRAATPQGFQQIIGASSAMRRVFDLVSRVSDTDATVLVTGESGTGKELIAKAIHEQSNRRGGPFLAINCAAMPAALLESELFGHVRGAFTDAKVTRSGLFLEATQGTLFLDEIGELPLEMQPKLLRSLQERKVRPVGGNQEVSFDSRIVAATNRDLETEVFEKRFREDLYYRINVVAIEVPPLRERGSDVLLLAQHFVKRAAERAGKQVKGIAAPTAEKLTQYDWPGNVRELENCMERAVALMRFDSIMVDDLPEKVRNYQADRFVLSADDPAELVTAAELERRYMHRVLALVGGNKSRAAKILGFNRRTLYRKMDRTNRGAAGADDATKLPVRPRNT
ncbi:MAG TPA: sigma-54 dependent transcriptional regulator [Polyangiaceae bacterium]|jgi:two-component system response regulator HydG|nr:sigma-54 dependent transcriptional regulator [Polyangiaceae bacterium]